MDRMGDFLHDKLKLLFDEGQKQTEFSFNQLLDSAVDPKHLPADSTAAIDIPHRSAAADLFGRVVVNFGARMPELTDALLSVALADTVIALANHFWPNSNRRLLLSPFWQKKRLWFALSIQSAPANPAVN